MSKVVILSIGIICIALSIFLNSIFPDLPAYKVNFLNLLLGIVIGTYASAILYYKSQFLNELQAVWEMLSSRVIPHEIYCIDQGAPVYDSSLNFLFNMQQTTTVKIRYDLGPQWYFLNGWRRARMVEMYEIRADAEVTRIFRARYSDLKKPQNQI